MFLIIVLSSCGMGTTKQEDKNVAGVKHFYFKFIDNVQSEYSAGIIKDVSQLMPQYDYLISEESAAKGWPFWGSVKRGSKVLKTDMMPPHSNVNRLSPIKELTTYNQGEHTMKVLFTIDSKNDSTLLITKESFKWKAGEWHILSKKLTTDFNINNNQSLVADKISKTLIRYTFK